MKFENLIKRAIGTKTILINTKNNRVLNIDKNGEIFWDSFFNHNYEVEKTVEALKAQYNPTDHNILKDFLNYLNGIDFLFKEENFQGNPIGRQDKKETIVDLISGEHILQRVYFELTERCPYKCVHCFCPQYETQELKTDEIKNILDQFFGLGTVFLTFTGGEPLIRKDFDEIYIYAKKRGFLINLFTNAFLINNNKIDLFKEYLPYNIDVTLYGSNKQTYETFTQKEGSFETFCSNLEKLKKNNIPFKLKTPISKINVNDIEGLIRFAERYCDNYSYTSFIFPKLNGNMSPLDYRCSPKEVICFEDNDKRKRDEWKKVINEMPDQVSNRTELKCSQGITDIALDSYGNLFFCSLLRYKGKNIKNNTIKECWEYLIKQREFFNGITRNSECGKCDIEYICNWCPGYSLIENGVLNKKVDYFCELNKERIKKYKKVRKTCEIL